MMSIEEVYDFILPYIKGLKLKKDTNIMVRGNELICIDASWTDLCLCILPQPIDYDDVLCGIDRNLVPYRTMVDFRVYNMMYNIYMNYMNIVPLHKDVFLNLEEDESFIEGTKLRASDTFLPYTFYGEYKKYYFPISYGLFPLIKGDKLDMEIYDLPRDMNCPFDTFMTKSIVHKKKLKCDLFIYRRLIWYPDRI